MLLSTVSFSLIFILDYVNDKEMLGKDSKSNIEEIIDSLAILIGFSWEQCFDIAVTVVAEGGKTFMPPMYSKLIMSVILVLIVFPAWRFYILRTEMDLNEAYKESATEAGQRKAEFKKMMEDHKARLLKGETPEHELDRHYLEMKHNRRQLHNIPHPTDLHPNLKHIR